MNALEIFDGNCSGYGEWHEDSFIYQLHEYSTWNLDAYYKLEWSIIGLIQQKIYTDFVSYYAFRLYTLIMPCLSAYFNSACTHKVENLTDDNVYDYEDRVTYIFTCYFAKKMPDNLHSFNYTDGVIDNPYLKDYE